MKLLNFHTKNGFTVPLGSFSILVGANNAGKSQTLRDIHDLMSNGLDQTNTIIVTELEFEEISGEEILLDLRIEEDQRHSNRVIVQNIGSDLRQTPQYRMMDNVLNTLSDAEDALTIGNVRNNLLQYKVAFLNASSRLEIATKTETYDIEDEYPSNAVQMLYEADEARYELREAFKFVFGKDILLDFSSVRHFRFRVDDDFGEVDENLILPKQSVDAPELDDQGAGYRSFAGVVLSLLLSENRIVLLDEPEAFLHPAQARRFGNWLSHHTDDIPGQVIIATHNSHFLSGVLSGGSEIMIHRLNRDGNTTRYTEITADTTARLATDPLLSSQRIIDGVFHEGVLVCEADSDSTIYQYVAEESLGYGRFLFTYGHNKQTIPRVVEALTDANVPRAAVVDIDIIRKPRDLKRIVQSMDPVNDITIHNKCNIFNQKLREQDIDWGDLKRIGVDAAPEDLHSELLEIVEHARERGVFIVTVGELEGWIDIGGAKGSQWVVEALDYLNREGCPDELERFVYDICNYLDNSTVTAAITGD